MPATLSDILGRKIDVLGVAQNVDLSTAGQGISTTIFRTGNIEYPSPSQRLMVAYVTVDWGTSPLAPNCTVKFGIAPNYDDWSQVGLAASPWNVAANLPALVPPAVGYSQATSLPIVYGINQDFRIIVTVGTATPARATVTAYGWAS